MSPPVIWDVPRDSEAASERNTPALRYVLRAGVCLATILDPGEARKRAVEDLQDALRALGVPQ